VSEEFQINTYTTGRQDSPSVAVQTNGDFVVVWRSEGSNGTDTDDYSMQGQRFDAAGMPVGGEFQVNSYTTGYQGNTVSSSVSGLGDGRFVVVWTSDGSYGNDTDSGSIQAQRFDTAGMRVGAQFQVNTYTTDYQFFASVAIAAGGDFVVVWASDGSGDTDTSGLSIQGQRFDVDGIEIGGEFQINTHTPFKQNLPEVALNSKGDFVVVWESVGSSDTDTDGYSIQGQRFDAAGGELGAQFQVNTITGSDQRIPKVAVEPEGDFVVIWESDRSSGTDDSLKSVQGQRYDAKGAPVGEEFQVNTYTTSHQRFPSVAIETNGDFIVAWESFGSTGGDTDRTSIQIRRFDAAGASVGGEFQVNTYTTGYQGFPSVGIGSDGDFAVVWTSVASAGSLSIQGRRLATPIFTDGFESGDTSAWSSVQ
jgi:hypothetical protein